jgi:spore germination cell wall hydrolase CwlJ-like protein
MKFIVIVFLLFSSIVHAGHKEDWCSSRKCWTGSNDTVITPVKNSHKIAKWGSDKSNDYTVSVIDISKEPKEKPFMNKVAQVFSLKNASNILDTDVMGGHPILRDQSKKDMECLAYSVFREAHTLAPKDQYAVAQIHVNRLKTGKWGDKMCEVVFAKAQFSWTLEKTRPWDEKQKAYYMDIAKGMMKGGLHVRKLDDDSVLHYHANYVNPKWAKKDNVVAVGAHIFYRDIP